LTEATIRTDLEHPDLGVRIRAVLATQALDPEIAVPLLTLAINDKNARVRYSAVSMLGRKRSTQTKDLLTTCLFGDKEFDVRAAAAASLGDLGDREVFDDLARAYSEDAEEMVQFSVVAALGELGDSRAFPLLQSALALGGLQEEAALMALGQIGEPAAIAVLLPYLNHEEWQLRLRAVQSLLALGAVAMLRDHQDPNPDIQQTIALALETSP
jgi:HEAT repeat protein